MASPAESRTRRGKACRPCHRAPRRGGDGRGPVTGRGLQTPETRGTHAAHTERRHDRQTFKEAPPVMTKHRITRRDLLTIGAIGGMGAAIRFEVPTLFQSAAASVALQQTPLPGASVQ